MRPRLIITALALLLTAGPSQAGSPDEVFILATSVKPPDAVAAAIKSHSEAQDWRFISQNRVKQGEVTIVKICIPAVAKFVWNLGLHLSAMLPCGNIGIYESEGITQVSVLHPRYMPMLHPDPALEQAAAVAEPLLREMLDVVTR